MSKIPGDLKYTKTHEWVRIEDDNRVTVGITDHAQAALGDMVFVDMPQINTKVEAKESCVMMESIKAASDVYSPVGGTIVETNAKLSDSPELVNEQPYGKGWIFQLRIDDADELGDLMTPPEYDAFCFEEK